MPPSSLGVKVARLVLGMAKKKMNLLILNKA
jgi:hypothetical protein